MTESPPSPPARAFTPPMIGIASVIGTPVAGGILMSVNAWRARQPLNALIVLAMGLLFTYSMWGLLPVVPKVLWPAMLPAAGIIMAWGARTLQDDILTAHERAGAPPGSRAAAAGIAVVCGLVIFPSIYFYTQHKYREAQQQQQAATAATIKLTSMPVTPNQSLLYSEQTPVAEAQAVATVLRQNGIFDNSGRPAQVLLFRENGRTVLGILNDLKSADDVQVERAINALGIPLSQAGVKRPFVIRLLDGAGKTVRNIVFEPFPERPTELPTTPAVPTTAP